MKKYFPTLFLLIHSIQIASMDQPNPAKKTKELRQNMQALAELTDKSMGCSEYKHERDRKYSKEKDAARQKQHQSKIAAFLQKMNLKYASIENKPVWLTKNHIDAEAKPFSHDCTDAKEFIDSEKPIWCTHLSAHCIKLNKMEKDKLSEKDAALLKFAQDTSELEEVWSSWYCRKAKENRTKFFEKPIAFKQVTDASGKPVRIYNKKENAWENVVEEITVQEHLNSPHFKRSQEHLDLFHNINVMNALENESYHKELMFLQRQKHRMKLFNTIDRQKLEQELYPAWEKRNNELQKIDNEWNSIFCMCLNWFQRIFNYEHYKKRIEYRKLVCEEEYSQEYNQYLLKHASAIQNLTQAEETQKRLKQEIKWFQDPKNRTTFTRSGIIGKQNFADIQRSREQYVKE